MPNSHPSDFKRNLRREVAGYFIVILCALPIRFWLYSAVQGQEGWLGFLAEQAFGDWAAPATPATRHADPAGAPVAPRVQAPATSCPASRRPRISGSRTW